MSVADELKKVQDLRASGAITDDEFARAKQAVLNGPPGWSHDPRLTALRLLAQRGYLPHLVGLFFGVLLSMGLGVAVYEHLEHTGRGVDDDWAGLAIVAVGLLGGVLGWLVGAGVTRIRKLARMTPKE